MSETCTCGICQDCVDAEANVATTRSHIELKSGDLYKSLKKMGTYEANVEYLEKAIDAANSGFRAYINKSDMDLRAKLVNAQSWMLLISDLLSTRKVQRRNDEISNPKDLEDFQRSLDERRKSGHKHKSDKKSKSEAKPKRIKLEGPPVANPKDLLYKTDNPKEREIIKMLIKAHENNMPWQMLVPVIKSTNPTIDVDGLIKKIGLAVV